MTKFTPGPWKTGGRIIETDRPARECEDVAEVVIHAPYEVRFANARLIAKAPEMYAMLEEIRSWIDNGEWWMSDSGKGGYDIAKIDAILSEINQ